MGATLRGRDATRAAPSGSCHLVRISDISQDGELLSQELTRIEPNERINDDLFLRPGDVLFPNRGTRTTAIAFNLDRPRTLVGSQFFILRPKTKHVLPEYLAWFLRSSEASQYFDERRKGTYVQIIQRSDLADLEMPVPSLPEQHKIVEVANLTTRERVITEQLSLLQWKVRRSLLTNIAENLSGIKTKERSQ